VLSEITRRIEHFVNTGEVSAFDDEIGDRAGPGDNYRVDGVAQSVAVREKPSIPNANEIAHGIPAASEASAIPIAWFVYRIIDAVITSTPVRPS
jgi:hypothetical protein